MNTSAKESQEQTSEKVQNRPPGDYQSHDIDEGPVSPPFSPSGGGEMNIASERDSLLNENDELKATLFANTKVLETQRQENIRLERELQKQKSLLQTKLSNQKLLEDQLKASYLISKMTKDQLASSMNRLLKVSQQVASGKPIYATPEITRILEKENLVGEGIDEDPMKVWQLFLFLKIFIHFY
jgi:small-conductance mechanosensitive channel